MSRIGPLIDRVRFKFLKFKNLSAKVDVYKILVLQSEEFSSFNSLLKEGLQFLKPDYDIIYCEINDLEKHNREVFDFSISDIVGFQRLSKLKIRAHGVFVNSVDEGRFVLHKSKHPYVMWHDCNLDLRFQFVDRLIPISFTQRSSYNQLNHLARNFSYRLRDGIDVIESKTNPYSTLLLPGRKLEVGRLSFAASSIAHKGEVEVVIGNYCSIGEGLLLITENHDTRYIATQGFLYRYYFNDVHPGTNTVNPSRERTKGVICIENDVWIGDRVIILSGVTIGNGACIAAGSIVTKDVEPFTIVAGVPAKKVKDRFIYKEGIVNWWEWSNSKIIQNKSIFFKEIYQDDR